MKRQAFKIFKVMVSLFVTVAAFMLAPSIAKAAETDTITFIYSGVRDMEGNPISATTPPDTLLFHAANRQPILAPDGHQLTLEEYRMPEGLCSAICLRSGTHTAIQLSGLIPDGVYTIWVFAVRASGEVVGVGSLGARDGSENGFISYENGDGEIWATMPGGPLSITGMISPCWLTGEFEVRVVAAYHLDGETHGPAPGPSGSFFEHFGFTFRRDQ